MNTQVKKLLRELKAIQRHIDKDHEMYGKLKTLIKLCDSHTELDMPFYTAQWDEIIRILHNWHSAAQYKGESRECAMLENAIYA